MSSEQLPDTIIISAVVLGLPNRSASAPPNQQPSPPAANIAKVA
jgi:hypothetical protein